ncbi:MAG: helix-turn-helix domain-containing protein [Gammaproteobacteria bacterium]
MTEKDLPPDGPLTIGPLSRCTGVHIETIRYYERIGLLKKPPRTPGGHRLYPDEARRRLHFIRRARELGFTLEQVRGLLRMVDGGHYSCSEIYELAQGHLREVREKIEALTRLEQVLGEVAARCSRDELPDCPIVEALSSER